MAGFIEYGIFSSLGQDNVSEREREREKKETYYCMQSTVAGF